MTDRRFYQNIQMMRGVAALLVFFVHLFATNPGMVPWLIQTGSNVVGPAGVDIFFVISGFVVTISAMNSTEGKNRKSSAAMFILRRSARIYPLYFIALTLAYIASPYIILSPEWMPKASALQLYTLTYPYNNKLMVAWTLVYEMFFYSVLTLLILTGKNKFISSLYIWIAIEVILIVSTNIYDINLSSYVPLNPQIIQFSAGCIIAILITKNVRQYAKPIFWLGAILFVIMSCINIQIANWESWARTLTLTLPAAMLIYGAAAMEEKKLVPFHNVFMWLGKISFSLYLLHQLIFDICFFVFDKLNIMKSAPNTLTLIAWSTIALFVANITHKTIEAPSYKFLSGIINSFSFGKSEKHKAIE
ncbi:acyltransferase [Cedecea davisae]|uniref:Acyltransferase n=1 Tax=Cedecea davisae TaxID=158484 RepID=A0ABS6DH10_9ENTR|nr:acyltransferase [Cedecea davisae]MBU4682494.1 acyltransferase [Cedecea davisae]MBU4688072.1 acyltransferase [Cedecea davisae]